MRPRLRIGVPTVLLAVLCASCGSSGGGSAAPSTRQRGTPAHGATLAQISRAYKVFFDGTSTTPQSEAALQHGSSFVAALKEQAKSSFAASSSATVDSVVLTGPDLAAVRFTISSDGRQLLGKVPGYAVRVDGRWLVAAKTFCTLLTLSGDAPDACNDPAITALPH